MKAIDAKVKQGSSELVILSLLARGDLHGYQIAQKIEDLSEGMLRFELASLYPVLYRMLKQGWVEAYWENSDAGRKRRYYRLTAAGRQRLHPLRQNWRSFFQALDRIARLQHG
jgi:transcriptional regulator